MTSTSYFSILPAQLSVYEVWAVRFFLFLAIAAAGPWFLIVIYDFLYYIFRITTYEIPIVGGRARGRQRPRAPSLVERPDGSHRRGLSLGAGGSRERGDGGRESEGVRGGQETEGVRIGERSEDVRIGEKSGHGSDGAWKVRGDINGEWDGVEELRRRTLAGGLVGAGQEEDAEGGEWDVRLRGRQI